MGSPGADLDRLPPEARFAIRAAAAGLSLDEVAAVLRLDGETARKHARTVVRETGGSPPPPASGDDALHAALAPALALAATPPRRVPGTACPDAEIAGDLAHGRLDGPLLLATAEHAADCPPCMTALVAARRAGPDAAPPPVASPRAARRRALPWILLALAVAALVAWGLLR